MKEQELIKFDLVGIDPENFNRLFSKLTKTIEDVFSILSKNGISDSTKETIENISSISKDFIKAKVQKPSIENQKLMAEITAKYAEAEERVMSARKTRAEAESIALDNARKKLRYTLEVITELTKLKLSCAGENNLVIDISEDKD